MKADKDPEQYEYLKIPDYLMPKPRVYGRSSCLWWPAAMLKYSVLPYLYPIGLIRGRWISDIRA
jgi:hypothetical protein